MGRHAEGFRVRRRGRFWQVRFTLGSDRLELSTGVATEQPRTAAVRAARVIYAKHAQVGRRKRVSRTHAAGSESIRDWVTRWGTELSIRPTTRVTYEKYAGYWAAAFPQACDLTEVEIERYVAKRLAQVTGKSLRNELSAFRGFLRWLVTHGALPEVPAVPAIPRDRGGTRYAQRRRTRAPELSPEEIAKLLRALPERSRGQGWPIRARFIVMHEATLRPATLDKLRVPTNYTRGADSVIVTDEDDKERFGRTVALTRRARRALDSVCPDVGLIFGRHRYDPYIREAATRALPAHKARILCGQHFRSAAITHWLEHRAGNLPGVQHQAGHKHASTTSVYIRPSERAAREMVKKSRK